MAKVHQPFLVTQIKFSRPWKPRPYRPNQPAAESRISAASASRMTSMAYAAGHGVLTAPRNQAKQTHQPALEPDDLASTTRGALYNPWDRDSARVGLSGVVSVHD